jgi:hypothetical protein
MTIEREKLLSKIRALISKRLEAGCTEAEAMTALEKAQAMMAAYEVTEVELKLTKEEKAMLRREPPGTPDPHQIKWRLMGGVAQFTNAKAWREPTSKGRGITFCGLRPDVEYATWLLDSLTRFVQARLVEHLIDTGPARGERRTVMRNFVIGLCERLDERMTELREQTATVATSNAKALVVAKDAAIEAKMEELDIHVRSMRDRCDVSDHGSYEAGRAAGDRASFGRPVSGRNATLRLR